MTHPRRAFLSLVLAGVAAPALAQQPSPSPTPAGPVGGPNAFATSLTLFAGTRSGLWRSTDWGTSWKKVTSPSSGDKVEDVGAVHEVVTLAPHVFVGGENGIYYSRDFGTAWTRLKYEGAVRCLMTTRWPNADPTLLVGAAGGLFVSPNGGYTFHPTPISMPVNRLHWPGPELVVATAGGVAISRDTATTLLPPGQGIPSDEILSIAVSTLYALDPTIFAGTASNGLWRSADGGRTWTVVPLAATTVRDVAWIGTQLFVATDAGVMLSEDQGGTWSKPATGLEGRIPDRFLFPHAPDSTVEAFVATDDGLFRTFDAGRTWKRSGLDGEKVLTVATFPPQTSPGDPRKKGRRR